MAPCSVADLLKVSHGLRTDTVPLPPLRLLPRVLKFLWRVRETRRKCLKRLTRRLSDLTTGVATRSRRAGPAGSGARSCVLLRVVRISRAAFSQECVSARRAAPGPVIKQAERLLKTAG